MKNYVGYVVSMQPILCSLPQAVRIYKRAMKLAYGDDWVYDYEGFVRFDENSRNMESRSVFKLLTEEEQNTPSTLQLIEHQYRVPMVIK